MNEKAREARVSKTGDLLRAVACSCAGSAATDLRKMCNANTASGCHMMKKINERRKKEDMTCDE